MLFFFFFEGYALRQGPSFLLQKQCRERCHIFLCAAMTKKQLTQIEHFGK